MRTAPNRRFRLDGAVLLRNTVKTPNNQHADVFETVINAGSARSRCGGERTALPAQGLTARLMQLISSGFLDFSDEPPIRLPTTVAEMRLGHT